MTLRLFVAGATGATAAVFIPMATAHGLDLLLHVRPQSAEKTPLAKDPRARVLDLADGAALDMALSGCDAVLSLIGTMRQRFDRGDTYESSDIATTRQLVDAAERTAVPRFLLLSSFGAGGAGAYLQAKKRAEDVVRASKLRWTIFRPSMLVSPDGAESAHGTRKAPPGSRAVFGAIRAIPGLGGWADDAKPIPIETLSRAFLAVLASPRDGEVLAGRDLWHLAP